MGFPLLINQMNRIVLLLLLVFLASCVKTNIEKARNLVEEYCDDNFFSPEDYKPILFEDFKIYAKPFEQSAQYKLLDSKRQKLELTKDSLYALIYDGKKKPLYDQEADSLDKAMAEVNASISDHKQRFKVVQEGWTILHTYNKRDDTGRIVEGRSLFVLDKNLTKVLDVTDK